MGTYFIPRSSKGESRILLIFSVKGLIYTSIGAGIGIPFYLLFKSLDMTTVGFVIIGILAVIGFAIGTFKIPNAGAFEFTKKTGGENVDEIIKRAIKFKMSHKKIYVYEYPKKKEETKDE